MIWALIVAVTIHGGAVGDWFSVNFNAPANILSNTVDDARVNGVILDQGRITAADATAMAAVSEAYTERAVYAEYLTYASPGDYDLISDHHYSWYLDAPPYQLLPPFDSPYTRTFENTYDHGYPPRLTHYLTDGARVGFRDYDHFVGTNYEYVTVTVTNRWVYPTTNGFEVVTNVTDGSRLLWYGTTNVQGCVAEVMLGDKFGVAVNTNAIGWTFSGLAAQLVCEPSTIGDFQTPYPEQILCEDSRPDQIFPVFDDLRNKLRPPENYDEATQSVSHIVVNILPRKFREDETVRFWLDEIVGNWERHLNFRWDYNDVWQAAFGRAFRPCPYTPRVSAQYWQNAYDSMALMDTTYALLDSEKARTIQYYCFDQLAFDAWGSIYATGRFGNFVLEWHSPTLDDDYDGWDVRFSISPEDMEKEVGSALAMSNSWQEVVFMHHPSDEYGYLVNGTGEDEGYYITAEDLKAIVNDAGITDTSLDITLRSVYERSVFDGWEMTGQIMFNNGIEDVGSYGCGAIDGRDLLYAFRGNINVTLESEELWFAKSRRLTDEWDTYETVTNGFRYPHPLATADRMIQDHQLWCWAAAMSAKGENAVRSFSSDDLLMLFASQEDGVYRGYKFYKSLGHLRNTATNIFEKEIIYPVTAMVEDAGSYFRILSGGTGATDESEIEAAMEARLEKALKDSLAKIKGDYRGQVDENCFSVIAEDLIASFHYFPDPYGQLPAEWDYYDISPGGQYSRRRYTSDSRFKIATGCFTLPNVSGTAQESQEDGSSLEVIPGNPAIVCATVDKPVGKVVWSWKSLRYQEE